MTHFLTFDVVMQLHADQIEAFGGDAGIRDVGLLQSALAMPEATFDGALLHVDIWEQAAAYLFHLCKNHPFVNGNKRVALYVTIVFLEENGIILTIDQDEIADLILGVAEGRVTKSEVAVFFMHHRDT